MAHLLLSGRFYWPFHRSNWRATWRSIFLFTLRLPLIRSCSKKTTGSSKGKGAKESPTDVAAVVPFPANPRTNFPSLSSHHPPETCSGSRQKRPKEQLTSHTPGFFLPKSVTRWRRYLPHLAALSSIPVASRHPKLCLRRIHKHARTHTHKRFLG